MADQFYHYPSDFLQCYRTEVEKDTADDVTRVARKYVRKERMAELVLATTPNLGAAERTGPGAEG